MPTFIPNSIRFTGYAQITDTVNILAEASSYDGSRLTAHQRSDRKITTNGSCVPDGVVKMCANCSHLGHTIRECYKLKTCSYCGRKGHVKAICFQLKNYNRNNSSTRRLLRTANAYRRGWDAPIFGNCEADTMMNDIVGTVPGKLCNTFPDKSVLSVAGANFGGTLLKSQVCSVSNNYGLRDWIVDTGASDHMSSNTDMMHDIRPLRKSILVGLPDGNVKIVHKIGKVTLSPTITLHDVLIVPDFKQNLLSVGKLISNTSMIAMFNCHECVFKDPSSKEVFGRAQKMGDLYWFQRCNDQDNPSSIVTALGSRVSPILRHKFNNNLSMSVQCNQEHDLHLFHSRIGHTSLDKMKHMMSSPGTLINKFFCETCVMSKHHILPFSRSDSHARHCFDLIHMDIWGPYKIQAVNGAKYFLTILDDHSRNTWTFLFQNKEQVPGLLKDFLIYVKTQFDSKVKAIRSDQGTEFVQQTCSRLFLDHGIVHQKSVVGRPQQNGRVERKHRHLIETARALKNHSNLPKRFWGDCVLTATYLINMMPAKNLSWKTPFELLLKEKPLYDNLRVFGCLCYATMPSTYRDKFGVKGRKCVFLGYPFGQKGYKLYDLNDHVTFVSRDVIFRENEQVQTTATLSEKKCLVILLFRYLISKRKSDI